MEPGGYLLRGEAQLCRLLRVGTPLESSEPQAALSVVIESASARAGATFSIDGLRPQILERDERPLGISLVGHVFVFGDRQVYGECACAFAMTVADAIDACATLTLSIGELSADDGALRVFPYGSSAAAMARYKLPEALATIHWAFTAELQDKLVTSARDVRTCDECESLYYHGTSTMDAMCAECAHLLYRYPRCVHDFANGRCRVFLGMAQCPNIAASD